jgi:parallel beta-helix repeat protein
MTDFFARLTGSDTPGLGDGTTTKPWRTIQYSLDSIVALPNAGNGDRLLLGDGDWGACNYIILPDRPTATDYLTIESENRRLAMLGHGGTQHLIFWQEGDDDKNYYKFQSLVFKNFRCFEQDPLCSNHHLWWEDCEFDGSTESNGVGYCIHIMGATEYVIVKDNYSHDSLYGLLQTGTDLSVVSTHLLVEGNEIGGVPSTVSEGNREDGLTMSYNEWSIQNDPDVIIRRNVIYGRHGSGMDIKLSFVVIEDNICYSNMEGGIKIWGQGKQITNNLCYGNTFSPTTPVSSQYILSHAHPHDNSALPYSHIVDHNTAVVTTSGVGVTEWGAQTAGGSANKIEMTNNIIVGGIHNTNTAGWKHTDMVLTNNLYYWHSLNTEYVYKDEHSDTSHTYANPGDFIGATDLIADPLFNGDYTPGPDSPAYGMSTTGKTVGFLGVLYADMYKLAAEKVWSGDLDLITGNLTAYLVTSDYVYDPDHTLLTDIPDETKIGIGIVLPTRTFVGENLQLTYVTWNTIPPDQVVDAILVVSTDLNIPVFYTQKYYGRPLTTTGADVNMIPVSDLFIKA